MKRARTIALVIVGVATGCGVAKAETVRLPSTKSGRTSAIKKLPNTGTTQPIAKEIRLQPVTDSEQQAESSITAEPVPPGIVSPSSGLALEELMQLALASNPAIAQADAQLQALRGQRVQVGLPPNPTIGYAAEEIGDNGSAGKQGGFVRQQFITGGKLRLNRAVLSRQIGQAQQRLQEMRLRVRTDVRKAFYAALIAQRRIDLAEQLVQVGSQAADASGQLYRAEEIPKAGLLQTQIDQQNFEILLQTARNEQRAAWRQLSAVVGRPDLAHRPLSGDVSQLPAMLEWDEQLARVVTTSPEVSAALAGVERAEAALARARVQPIPDVFTQVGVQHDYASGDTVARLQVGLPLPLWNRNQGGIRQAEAETAEARRNAARVELDLQRRLALAYQQYANALAQTKIYTSKILPKSQETYELVQRGYRLGEIGYLDLLTAQRTYSQTNLAYLDALSALWASWTEIDGLLLSGSLATTLPHGAMPGARDILRQ